jgi:hypothetical protein
MWANDTNQKHRQLQLTNNGYFNFGVKIQPKKQISKLSNFTELHPT